MSLCGSWWCGHLSLWGQLFLCVGCAWTPLYVWTTLSVCGLCLDTSLCVDNSFCVWVVPGHLSYVDNSFCVWVVPGHLSMCGQLFLCVGCAWTPLLCGQLFLCVGCAWTPLYVWTTLSVCGLCLDTSLMWTTLSVCGLCLDTSLCVGGECLVVSHVVWVRHLVWCDELVMRFLVNAGVRRSHGPGACVSWPRHQRKIRPVIPTRTLVLLFMCTHECPFLCVYYSGIIFPLGLVGWPPEM